MRTVQIVATFDGYPEGKKRTFVAGASAEVTDDYADMLVEKGLAREKGAAVEDNAAGNPAAAQKRRRS